MDGTLTPPRQKIEHDVVSSLKNLSKDFDIGIVSGSDYDYIMSQCKDLFDIGGLPVNQVLIFPCNGTKFYRANKSNSFEKVFDVNMRDEIGIDAYNYIIQTLISYQLMITLTHNLPYTGNFFQYRGSTLNWCPIGRSAKEKERLAWCQEDNKSQIRKSFLEKISACFDEKNIPVTVVLGGETSFDIYPKGWDKTYVLNHVSEYKKIYFVGDKCDPGGNDFHLHNLLNDGGSEHDSFSTSGPDETRTIIHKILNLSEET